ncbi:MAG: hypothetical protein QOH72_1356 [Solirubrobacteraceae bacterium]|jgi:hypothetical protein|nr:hypothetical protein [Solirubrobacteraceae bacterium]
MISMRHRVLSARRAGVATLLTGSVLALPDAASAHGIGGATDLPIPGWLFAWGATAVLILSFVALGVLWPKARLESMGRRGTFTLPRFADPAAALVGMALTGLVLVSAFAGTTDTATNLAPTFVWVAFWVGVPLATVVFGDFYTALDPWRTIARLAGAASRALGRAPRTVRPYPGRAGRWPAAAGLALIGWMELVWVRRDDPRALGVVILAYGAIQLAGIARYGIVAWRRNADPFAVYTHVLSHAAPVVADGRRVSLRAPLSGLPALAAVPGTVAVMCALIGTTSYDGLSRGMLWGKIGPQLGTLGGDLGLATPTANQVTGTIGLCLALALVAGVYRVGVTGMRKMSRGATNAALGARFAHTLVPIAVAYVVAHYFSLVALQGQALASLASDPLGNGANIFGTASVTVNYALLSAGTIWAVQVIALVAGHVGGLVLAHDRALTTYSDHRRAMRSQRFMLVVMVGFTSLGLWLLSGA